MPGFDDSGDDHEGTGRKAYCSNPKCQCEVPIRQNGKLACGHGKVDFVSQDDIPVGLEDFEDQYPN